MHNLFRFKLNLQFFAADNGGAGGGAGDNGGTGEGDQQGAQGAGAGTGGAGTGEGANGSQGQALDEAAITAKAQAAILKSLGFDDAKSAKDAVKDYNARKQADMTELEKVQSQLAEAQKQATESAKSATVANARAAAATNGVTAENLDDVVLLAQAKVTDKVTIEDAIKQVIEAHPDMAKASTDPKGPSFGREGYNAGNNQQGGGSGESKDTEAFKAAMAKAFGGPIAKK
jgi:hypothetical protein